MKLLSFKGSNLPSILDDVELITISKESLILSKSIILISVSALKSSSIALALASVLFVILRDNGDSLRTAATTAFAAPPAPTTSTFYQQNQSYNYFLMSLTMPSPS